MQTSDYKNHWAISQSAIKEFRLKNPKRWKEIWIDKQLDLDDNEDTFVFGSVVDTLLFSPHLFDERIFVADSPTLPSTAIESILKAVQKRVNSSIEYITYLNQEETLPNPIAVPSPELKNWEEFIIQEADNVITDPKTGKKGWSKNWKTETRIAKIIEEGNDYYNFLIKAAGRKVISGDMNLEAIEVRDILLKDKSVNQYFVQNEGEELRFQFEIFINATFHGKEIPLKGALDILRIDHNKQTIQIADFKTSFNSFDFVKSIKHYDYVGQLSFYDFLLREWLKEYCDGKYCEYTILAPINIVIDRDSKVPYIYEYDWKDIALAREGNAKYLFDLYQTLDHNSRVRKGWYEVLEDIAWHYVHNKWDKPKELYINGKIKVNLLNS